ncbi:hypothetical protein LCGC14_2382630 [marine sediment metagenome]|uniref:Uncharacterized protein n=1 Tax=marine sediment metagenome TaxID=412755 RepID=A0A0F9CML2_9ZZZZ
MSDSRAESLQNCNSATDMYNKATEIIHALEAERDEPFANDLELVKFVQARFKRDSKEMIIFLGYFEPSGMVMVNHAHKLNKEIKELDGELVAANAVIHDMELTEGIVERQQSTITELKTEAERLSPQ